MSQPGSNPPSRGGLYGNEARRPASQGQGEQQQRRHTSSAGMGFIAGPSNDIDEEDMDINENEDTGEVVGGTAPQANASENPWTFTVARRVVSSYFFRDANASGPRSTPLNEQDTSHRQGGQGAQDMPGTGGTSAPHFGEQQERNQQQTGPQPHPPPPDHWAWLMMGTIHNILALATTTRDQVAHLEATLNTPGTGGRTPTQPPGPRLAQPPSPRGPIHNREQVVLRTSLISRWLGGRVENAPPQPDASMLAAFEQQRRVHPRGALPAVNVPGNAILFSSSNKFWNRAMAKYFIENILTQALNAEVPKPGGPRDFRASNQRQYFKKLVKRVCDCVHYIFQVKAEALIAGRAAERNESSRKEMSRSRLLNLRVAKAQNTPWLLHTVPALQMLNDDGMSSEEEDLAEPTRRNIHAHPWRSEAVTTLIRAIDDARRDDRIFSGNRKRRPNARLWTPERSQSLRAIAIPFHATPLLPENFYNWEVLRRRQDFISRNLDPRDVYHPTQARPDLLTFSCSARAAILVHNHDCPCLPALSSSVIGAAGNKRRTFERHPNHTVPPHHDAIILLNAEYIPPPLYADGLQRSFDQGYTTVFQASITPRRRPFVPTHRLHTPTRRRIPELQSADLTCLVALSGAQVAVLKFASFSRGLELWGPHDMSSFEM
ncbi:hypothetical protein CPB85DRAFT_1440851 [Mucidula mucida]|nr:hypothetical protein CPB85DRAFT_1440851 [Mucidula mucida]